MNVYDRVIGLGCVTVLEERGVGRNVLKNASDDVAAIDRIPVLSEGSASGSSLAAKRSSTWS